MKSPKNIFFSGTSGLVLAVAQSQYPADFQGKSRLTYYSSLFNSVEINSSFYKLSKTSTIIKWADSVPDNFQFTFKLPKIITHAKELAFKAEDVELFMSTIGNIRDKKGCLLVQFPPGLKIEKIDKVQSLLKSIKTHNANNTWKVAIEFRNNSWYTAEVYQLLDQYNVSLVVHDLPASATPFIDTSVTFKYLRFHGPGGKYRGSYSEELLNVYAHHIKTWMGNGKSVYFYFNNTMGDAVKNLETLNGFLR